MLKGYTIKSVSEDGTFYLVKDWRKNKAIWVKRDKLTQNMVFKRPQDAKASLSCLLKVMSEYATDEFTLVEFF